MSTEAIFNIDGEWFYAPRDGEPSNAGRMINNGLSNSHRSMADLFLSINSRYGVKKIPPDPKITDSETFPPIFRYDIDSARNSLTIRNRRRQVDGSWDWEVFYDAGARKDIENVPLRDWASDNAG